MTDLLFGLAFALLVVAITLSTKASSESERPSYTKGLFIKLGIMSYSFYLIHSQFGWLVSLFVPTKAEDSLGLVVRLIALLISLIPIYYFFKWFEKPFLSVPKPDSKLYPLYTKLGNLLGVR